VLCLSFLLLLLRLRLLLLLLLLLQIGGEVGQVADACDANPACFSFDMEGSYGGYLKSAGAQEYTEGFNNYCKLDTEQSCTGEGGQRTETKHMQIQLLLPARCSEHTMLQGRTFF
jgi:hypothetical protein